MRAFSHAIAFFALALCACESAPTRRASEPPAAPSTARATPERNQPAFTTATSASVLREGHAHGLRYLEQVPALRTPDEALPLVMFVHGRGDRAHTAWTEGLDVRARYVFPEAPEPYAGGFSWFGYAVAQDDPHLARDVRARATQLVALLEQLVRERPTRGKPIVAGFSQGAILTYAIALEHPDAIALGLPIAGMIPASFAQDAQRSAPLRALHGTQDHVIAFAPTERAVAALRARGMPIELRAFEGVDHTLSPAMRALLFAWIVDAVREH